MSNVGRKPIDLMAPTLIFKRNFTHRRFKVKRIGHNDLFPMYLESGRTFILTISLTQFYDEIPELVLARRLQVEIKDPKGVKFTSETVRLKWF